MQQLPLLLGWALRGEVPKVIVCCETEQLHNPQLTPEPFTHPPFQTVSSVASDRLFPVPDPYVVPPARV